MKSPINRWKLLFVYSACGRQCKWAEADHNEYGSGCLDGPACRGLPFSGSVKCEKCWKWQQKFVSTFVKINDEAARSASGSACPSPSLSLAHLQLPSTWTGLWGLYPACLRPFGQVGRMPNQHLTRSQALLSRIFSVRPAAGIDRPPCVHLMHCIRPERGPSARP